MILLDTNVLSAMMRDPPEVPVMRWLDQQPRTSVWTTAVTALEIRFGLEIMPDGRRRSELIDAFERLLREKLARRIAPFDAAAAPRGTLAETRATANGCSAGGSGTQVLRRLRSSPSPRRHVGSSGRSRPFKQRPTTAGSPSQPHETPAAPAPTRKGPSTPPSPGDSFVAPTRADLAATRTGSR